MRKLMLLTVAATLVATGALAQSTVTTTTGAGRADVVVEPEARTRIKTYVTEKKLRPVAPRRGSRSERPFRATLNSWRYLRTGVRR